MKITAQTRWIARPRLAMMIRLAAYLVPAVVSFGAALLTQRWVDRVFPAAPWGVGAGISLIAAMVTLLVGERLGRRFLPLAMLLKLALLFPDQVPSRFSIALRAASPKRLAKQLASADPNEVTAAERVLALVSALSAHDRLTRGHCERVRAVTMLIADEMGITGVDRDKLEWAALLHDVGKMTVSPAILNKRGKPTDEEWAELRTHPGNGAPLAGELADWMGEWVHAIDQHHERFDGSGYPLGLAGSDISQAARIVSAADAFEVMTAVRSYKKAMPVAEARAELAACTGTHFDPLVVRSFASLSLAKLHRALGPASWALSLPFRGVVAQAFRGGGALVGGSAPSALASLTAIVVISLATTSMAGAVDGRFDDDDKTVVEAARSNEVSNDAAPDPGPEDLENIEDIEPAPSAPAESPEPAPSVPAELPEVVPDPIGESPEVVPEAPDELPELDVPDAIGELPELDAPEVLDELPELVVPDAIGELPELDAPEVLDELPELVVPDSIGELPDVIDNVLTDVTEEVVSIVTDIPVLPPVREAADAAIEVVENVASTATGLVTEIPEVVAETVTEIPEVVVETVTEIPEVAAETVEEIPEVVVETVTEIPEAVPEVVIEIPEVAPETIETGVGDPLDDVPGELFGP